MQKTDHSNLSQNLNRKHNCKYWSHECVCVIELLSYKYIIATNTSFSVAPEAVWQVWRPLARLIL